LGDPSLLALWPSRDQELTWAKVLKALTAAHLSPRGTNSITLHTARRLTLGEEEEEKIPRSRQVGEGGHGLGPLKRISLGMRESEAPDVSALPAPGGLSRLRVPRRSSFGWAAGEEGGRMKRL
jgi:hypothetical protein